MCDVYFGVCVECVYMRGLMCVAPAGAGQPLLPQLPSLGTPLPPLTSHLLLPSPLLSSPLLSSSPPIASDSEGLRLPSGSADCGPVTELSHRPRG